MKAIICLLVIIAGANAGFLFGGLDLQYGGGGVNGGGWGSVGSGWSGGGGWLGGYGGGGYGGGYGGGWNSAVPETKIIKVIEAPAPIINPAPIHIVKVIKEAQPIIPPAFKIIKIIEKPYIKSYGW